MNSTLKYSLSFLFRKSIANPTWADRYIYYKELDLVYVGLRKAGTSTINTTLLGGVGKKLIGNDNPNREIVNRCISRDEFLDLRLHKAVWSFSFVRNPINRIASCYTDQLVNKNRARFSKNYFGAFSDDMSFETFVDRIALIPDWYADPHFRSQTYFLLDKNDTLLVDYLGRIGNFEEDFSYIKNRYNLPEQDAVNVTGSADAVPDMYNKKIANKLYTRYERDFEMLGYTDDFKNFYNQLTD